MPTSVFEGLIEAFVKGHNYLGEALKYKGAKLEEIVKDLEPRQRVAGNHDWNIRLSYRREWSIDMWDVTWSYIIRDLELKAYGRKEYRRGYRKAKTRRLPAKKG
jgi:hypothetical protein